MLYNPCCVTVLVMGRTAILHMLLEPELKARLAAAAESDGRRSISSLARTLIEEGLERRTADE